MLCRSDVMGISLANMANSPPGRRNWQRSGHPGNGCQRRNKGEGEFVMRGDLRLGLLKGFYQEGREMIMGYSQEMGLGRWGTSCLSSPHVLA